MHPATFAIPHVGRLAAGAKNSIADVAGVTVGHCTLAEGDVQTGVTVVVPHGGNLFTHKLPAGVSVINGFGKSAGLMQIEELGMLESPIALTNTFSVGSVVTAQVKRAIQTTPAIGRSLPTVNAVVMECNDGYLNDLHAFAVTEAHVDAAFDDASADVQQGAVGAGRGMSCFGLKGGIGSASRLADVGSDAAKRSRYTVGALVLANFGRSGDLVIDGRRIPSVDAAQTAPVAPEKGSIIMLIATDAPLDARQLKRLATRAAAGLARTGSVYGHGSGDVALAFSTAQLIEAGADCQQFSLLQDHVLDPLFHAAADSVEQAIIHALFAAETVSGRDGHVRPSLRDHLATHSL